MKIGLIAMSGVRVKNQRMIELGVTLPQFVSRGKVIAQLPSLALLIIASLTPDDIDVEYVEIGDIKDVKDLNRDYDLVAISSYTAQAYEMYELADRYRKEKIPVVLGGLHVTVMPEEAKEHADAIVIGEAEPVWKVLIDDFKKGELKPVYRQAQPGSFDLTQSPVPRYDLLKNQQYNRITVQTVRGCPHLCEFCASSPLWGGTFRQKSVAQVLHEIETICQYWKNPFIEFADDNSFVNKKWAKDFLKKLARYNIRWFTESDISIAADSEMIDLMYQSGCYQLLIGLESISDRSLNKIDRDNWKLKQRDKYLKSIHILQSHGISVNGCFIAGLDGDTPDTFESIYQFIQESNLLEVQITVLTPFPGTPLYYRLKKEGRLLQEKFWDRCTLFDVNYHPKQMTVQELEDGVLGLFNRVYNEKEFTRRKRLYMEISKQLQGRVYANT